MDLKANMPRVFLMLVLMANRVVAAFSRGVEWPVHPSLAQPKDLDYWLSKFVLET